MSPRKKKPKYAPTTVSSKRENQGECSSSKRSRSVKSADEQLQEKKRKNFVTACEQVSYKAYVDQRARLLLIYLPECLNMTVCRHLDNNSTSITAMSSTAEETFMIDARTNMWAEALEVCIMCLTPTQYLSTNVLKEVVEIIMNAHEDEYAENRVSYVVAKSQQVLMSNFSLHPPCFTRRLRRYYNDFLTSPMNLKQNTFTNRTEYGCDKGIVKYCLNRLEHEISAESKDEPLIDKDENIPEEMKESVKGLYWQKEKFEIFELLERGERIERLMVVLETIIELLQFDLAIWHSRYKHNSVHHIMNSHKPLMAILLWSNNVVIYGGVNKNCRQILRLFVNLIHLKYPEKHINIMTLWLNTMVQTLYICETNSDSDYPNTGKYCNTFANEFYNIVSELPHDSIIRVLETIKPSYMRHLMAMLHIKSLLTTSDDSKFIKSVKVLMIQSLDEDCIKILIDFIKGSKWEDYPESEDPIELSTNTFFKPVNVKKEMKQLMKMLSSFETEEIPEDDCEAIVYPRLVSDYDFVELNRNHVVHTFFIALEAYIDAYEIHNVQETLDKLNKQLVKDSAMDTETNLTTAIGSYSVTADFVKKYKSMFQMLKELVLLFQELKTDNKIPLILDIFKNIELLDF